MADGFKSGGRQKGTPNKLSRAARDAISMAADDLGGKDRLVAWIKDDPQNERVFWSTIYTKLVPLQHSNDEDDGGPVNIKHTFEWMK